MSDYLKGRTVRLRCRKRYPDAHTHIIMGRVEAETPNYLVLQGAPTTFATSPISAAAGFTAAKWNCAPCRGAMSK